MYYSMDLCLLASPPGPQGVCWGVGVARVENKVLTHHPVDCTCSDTYAVLDLKVLFCLSVLFHCIPEGNEDTNLT